MRDTFFFRGEEPDGTTTWSTLQKNDDGLLKEEKKAAQTINIEAFLQPNGPGIKYIVAAKLHLPNLQTMQTKALTANVKVVDSRPDLTSDPSLRPIFDLVRSKRLLGNSTSDENWGGFVLALHAACNNSYDIPAAAFAFHRFQNSTLQVPAGFKNIRVRAFKGSELDRVVLPETIERIGREAFVECNLTSINFPASLTRLDDNAFSGSSIVVAQFDANSQIEEISDDCFAYCEKLQNVQLPDILQSIGQQAFLKCPKLQSINFPRTLQRIESWAFDACSGLQLHLEFTNSLQRIESEAFHGSGILSVRFPPESRVKNIETNTFGLCERLKEVQLPDGIEGIGERAFQNCHSLTTITVPTTLKRLQTRAFDACKSLQSIDLQTTQLKSIEERCFHGCTQLEQVILPVKLTEIKEEAFYHCTSLRSIEWPKTLGKIGARAFQKCPLPKELWLNGEQYAIGVDAFGQDAKTPVEESTPLLAPSARLAAVAAVPSAASWKEEPRKPVMGHASQRTSPSLTRAIQQLTPAQQMKLGGLMIAGEMILAGAGTRFLIRKLLLGSKPKPPAGP